MKKNELRGQHLNYGKFKEYYSILNIDKNHS
jgi:hypothetical protein